MHQRHLIRTQSGRNAHATDFNERLQEDLELLGVRHPDFTMHNFRNLAIASSREDPAMRGDAVMNGGMPSAFAATELAAAAHLLSPPPAATTSAITASSNTVPDPMACTLSGSNGCTRQVNHMGLCQFLPSPARKRSAVEYRTFGSSGDKRARGELGGAPVSSEQLPPVFRVSEDGWTSEDADSWNPLSLSEQAELEAEMRTQLEAE